MLRLVMFEHGHVHERSCGQGRYLDSPKSHRRGLFDETQQELPGMHLSSVSGMFSERNEIDRFGEQKLVTSIEGDEEDVDYQDEIESDGTKAQAKIQEAVAAFK